MADKTAIIVTLFGRRYRVTVAADGSVRAELASA